MMKRLGQAPRLKRLLPLIAKSDSRLFGLLGRVLASLGFFVERGGWNYRRLVDVLQPKDPLKKAPNLPSIDIITVTGPDTFHFAETALAAALLASRNPVGRMFAIVPDRFANEAREQIPSAEIVKDSTILSTELVEAINESSPQGREHWIRCQVLGLSFARTSESSGILLVDADTYLLQERTFLSAEGIQVLSFSYEFHHPYEKHAKSFLGFGGKFRAMSFISHYMLFQPEIMREIFPQGADLCRWVRSADKNQTSPIADYHTYGRWISSRHPEKVRWARWANRNFVWNFDAAMSSKQRIMSLREEFLDCASVSSHRYLERDLA